MPRKLTSNKNRIINGLRNLTNSNLKLKSAKIGQKSLDLGSKIDQKQEANWKKKFLCGLCHFQIDPNFKANFEN